jgi:hypothetical protein
LCAAGLSVRNGKAAQHGKQNQGIHGVVAAAVDEQLCVVEVHCEQAAL